jgi:predicted nucleic acid-binding protein
MNNDVSSVVIADSSALVSLISLTDANHEPAASISEALQQTKASVLLPADVFSETVNILGKRLGKPVALHAGHLFLDAGLFVIEEATAELRRSALAKLAEQNASVSYIDCVVMAYADHFSTKAIFGFDACFGKNGYQLPTAA